MCTGKIIHDCTYTLLILRFVNWISCCPHVDSGPGQLRRYSDSLRAGRSGDRIPVWGGRDFSHPYRPGAQPASYTVGTGSFPGVKRPGRGVDHPPTSSAAVKEYLYSPSGSSRPVLGWILPHADQILLTLLAPNGRCSRTVVGCLNLRLLENWSNPKCPVRNFVKYQKHGIVTFFKFKSCSLTYGETLKNRRLQYI